MTARAPPLQKGRDLNEIDKTSPLYRPPPLPPVQRQILGASVQKKPTLVADIDVDEFYRNFIDNPQPAEDATTDDATVSEIEASDLLMAMGEMRVPAVDDAPKKKKATAKKVVKPKTKKAQSAATTSTDF